MSPRGPEALRNEETWSTPPSANALADAVEVSNPRRASGSGECISRRLALNARFTARAATRPFDSRNNPSQNPAGAILAGGVFLFPAQFDVDRRDLPQNSPAIAGFLRIIRRHRSETPLSKHAKPLLNLRDLRATLDRSENGPFPTARAFDFFPRAIVHAHTRENAGVPLGRRRQIPSEGKTARCAVSDPRGRFWRSRRGDLNQVVKP